MLFIPGIVACLIVENQEHLKLEIKEDARIRALPPVDREFELRLREVKAMERQSRQQPTINVKPSIF